MSKTKWYKEGLKFGCTGCGKCCTGGPGYVWVTIAEIEAMALELAVPLQAFFDRYVRKIGNRYSLKEVKTERGYDCIFLKDKFCTLYETRPTQCRTYPFWPEFLKSRSAWEEVKSQCEGIDHEEAPLISPEQFPSGRS